MLQHGPGVPVICIKDSLMHVTDAKNKVIKEFSYKQNDHAVTDSIHECKCGKLTLCFGDVIPSPPNGGLNGYKCLCGETHLGENRVLFSSENFAPIYPAEQVTYETEEQRKKRNKRQLFELINY